jgi:hypothetical protein
MTCRFDSKNLGEGRASRFHRTNLIRGTRPADPIFDEQLEKSGGG